MAGDVRRTPQSPLAPTTYSPSSPAPLAPPAISITGATYAPATDGFVFQVAEIKQFIRRHNRSAFARDYQYGDSTESAQALRDFAEAA